MANITSLIVKIGAQDAEITAALSKLGSNLKRTDDEFKKLGTTPVAQQAQRSLSTLNDTVIQIQNSQQRLADRARLAAAGLDAMGGPARLTQRELEAVNRTIQQGLDAYRSLGQQAPKELQKVADAVAKQRKELQGGLLSNIGSGVAGQLPGGGALSGLLGGGGAAALAGGAATAATAALVAGARAAVQYADSLTKLADRTGIQIEALQRLQAVAEPSGNTLEQVAQAVNQFQKRISEGGKETVEALGRIGLTVEQLRALSPDEQFFAIAKGIQGIKDPADQAAVAMALFGKSGAELLPTLKADIDGLKDSTVRMSAESAKALDDLGDAWQRWKTNAIASIGEVIGRMVQFESRTGAFRSASQGFFGAAQLGFQAGQNFAPPVTLPSNTPNRPALPTVVPFTLDTSATQAQIALTNGLAEALKRSEVAVKAATEAERQRDADLKRFADSQIKVNAALAGYQAIVDQIDGSTVEAIRYFRAHGVAISALADYYGLTATQADAVAQKLDFEAKVAQAAAGIHAQLATQVYNVDTAFERLQGRNLARIPALTSGPNPQLQQLSRTFSSNLGAVLRQDLPRNIMAAITGGGSVIQAAGSTMGQFLVSEGGFGKKLSSGLTSLFGKGISDAISSLLPGIGALLGPLLSKIGEKLKDFFGGPSKQELEGRDAESSFESQFRSFDDMVNRVGDAFASTGRSRSDAEAAVKAMLDAERRGAEAVRQEIERLQGVLDAADRVRQGASQFGPSQSDLNQAAQDAKDVLDYMTRLQQQGEYTQDQVNEAYLAWQRAMAAAGNEAAKAWVAAHDAAVSGSTTASAAMDALKAKRDGLAQSIQNEAPEEVMGVIESQIRGQIAALDAQMQEATENTAQTTVETLNDAAKEVPKGFGEAAEYIKEQFGDGAAQMQNDFVGAAESARNGILDAFDGFSVTIPVHFNSDALPVPGASTGGRVTENGIQHFASGGRVLPFLRPGSTDTVLAALTPGEIVLNAAQQSRTASALMGAGGGEMHIHVHVGDRELGAFVLDDIAKGGKTFGKFRTLVRGVA